MLGKAHSFKFISKDKLRDLYPDNTRKTEIPRENIENLEYENKKRKFLKLAGVVGAGAIAATLLPKKAEALVFGSTPTSNTVGVKNAANSKINPATQETLAIVSTNTTPLVTAGGGAYVRQDSTATIAKETGGNLDIIAGKDFATQATLAAIKTQTDKFTFSGNNLLTAGSSGASDVGILDKDNVKVSPATEDSILYLRRIVKLMESQAVVDAGNRQRITLDSLGTGTAITTTVPVSGTVTSNIGTGTLSAVTTVSAITTVLGQNHQAFQDVARNTYANGIRNNLIFT